MKLLLAEDNLGLNRAIVAMLKTDSYEVEPTYDGAEALEHLTQFAYDAAILDIMMPKLSGLEVLTELRKQHDTTPVLLLTALGELDDKVRGLECGADDYLCKPFAMKELLARVHALCRREGQYDVESLSCGDLHLNSEKHEISAVNSIRVSAREFDLIQLMVVHHDKWLSSQYLLTHIWKDDSQATEETIELYISYLRNKLSYISSRALIVGSAHSGFLLAEGILDK